MDENERKQQMSIAYLHAVASAAGFACQATAVDNDFLAGPSSGSNRTTNA